MQASESTLEDYFGVDYVHRWIAYAARAVTIGSSMKHRSQRELSRSVSSMASVHLDGQPVRSGLLPYTMWQLGRPVRAPSSLTSPVRRLGGLRELEVLPYNPLQGT